MKRIKPRYIFCIVSIILLFVGYFIFLCSYSSRYTINLMLEGTTNIENVRVEDSDKGMIEVEGVRMERNSEIFGGMINSLRVDLKSVGSGKVSLSVYYEDIYDIDIIDENNNAVSKHTVEQKEYHSDFLVMPFGMIYDLSFDNYNGLWSIVFLFDAIMLVLIITLGLSVKEKAKNGDFTYSMVSLFGIVFFMAIILILSVYDSIISWGFRNIFNVQNYLYMVSQISVNFVNFTFIPFALFCLLLSISNIQLVRHEGFGVRNLLGIMLGFMVLAGMVILYISGSNRYAYKETVQMLLTVVNSGVSFAFCYLECMLVSTIVCALASTRYKIKQPMDYIIILGCAIRSDGTPTPILRGRIDRALAFDKLQNEKWNKQAKFVPSGGQGSNEVVSEAESMKRYLMEQGIPEERIIKEDKSVNTYQNMAFSKKVIENDADDISGRSIAFSTTNYHVFRGYTLAQKIGMKVKGLSAKTKLYFFPNAFLREFIGLLWEKKRMHILLVILGTVFFMSIYLILQY